MSPVLNCIPSSPPSEQETYPKGGSVASNESNRSPEISPSPKQDLVGRGTEDSCCEDVRESNELSERSSPTNNNSIPLNFKKSPSPKESLIFEPPIRPWNSSPNLKNAERGPSVSPSSSYHQPSPCPVSPDVSSEASRIPSHASSEAHEAVASPDGFRSMKMSAADMASDITFPFHENRLSSDSFRLSNSFIGDPINPYLRLQSNPLNPFQTPPSFLSNPFLGTTDSKLLLNNPNLGLITQQIHQLNGLSTNMNKLHPPDLQRLSMQQLQFLQSHLQSLPTLLHPTPYSKYPDPKNQLAMLIQARKQPKILENDLEIIKKDMIRIEQETSKFQDGIKAMERRSKSIEPSVKNRNTSIDESMEVDNYVDNNSDSDELLSVGSASPPPNCHVTPLRTEVDNKSDAGLSGLNCSSSLFSNRTLIANGTKKFSNTNPIRLQNNLTNTKPENVSNRTLKFSIDNILKSDFGNEEVVKKPKQLEKEKVKENERTSLGKKKPETEKETPVDLSQDNANTTSGTDTPMLWPAWVYCTRYSDRPSSGPRTRRSKNKDKNPEEKRPRTAFSGDQLSRLKHEFAENRYLTERRRQDLARELGLNEAQIKIWFQNKRAKMKKARGEKNPLALQLMAQGLYNHSTVPLTKEEEEAAAAELSD